MNAARTTRGLPLGLAGALVLVAVVERTIARHDLDFTEVAAVNWSYSKRAARETAPRTEILCFGTSLLKFGVLPRSIEAATGRTAFNLAACNSHMPTSYFLLRRALDAGARPAAILVDCQDGPVLAEDKGKQAEALRVNLRNWPELLSLGESLDLSWNSGDARFFATMVVAKSLPSYKARFEIRNAVKAAFGGKGDVARDNIIGVLRNWNVNLGTNVMPPDVTLKESDEPPPPAAELVPDRFAEGRWSRNRLTEEYTRRFLELAASHKVPGYWLIPPVPPQAVAIRRREGLDRYFRDLARSAQAISPGVTVIDGSQAGYAADTFCDVAHLNAKGSVVFSEGVARVVESALGNGERGPRWVELPVYSASERPIPYRLEDIEASRIAVKEGRLGAIR